MLKNNSSPIRVGIAGLGRSGWDIHGRTFFELPDLFEVTAVMDLDAARCAEAVAKFGCVAHSDYSALAADPNVEVIIVATPNFLHTAHTLEALRHGKHVVCEKPFGQSANEALEMISAAQQAGKLVAPFHNRRYEEHFLKVQEIVQSGLLGEIQLIRIAWHSFKRRGDWQTLSEFGGGELRNIGSHILDHALQFLGVADPDITVDLRNVLSSGDMEDHVKIVLRSPSAPLLEIELSNACAFQQDRWLIIGDAGGLRGSILELEWKWVNWSEHAACVIDRKPPQNRAYPSDDVKWQHASWRGKDDFSALPHLFFQDFYESVRNGRPLVITPESAVRIISITEKCKKLTQIKQGRFSLSHSHSDKSQDHSPASLAA